MEGTRCVKISIRKKYSLSDLHIGVAVHAEPLGEIYNKSMIAAFDSMESRTGKLVFCGDVQDQEYDKCAGITWMRCG